MTTPESLWQQTLDDPVVTFIQARGEHFPWGPNRRAVVGTTLSFICIKSCAVTDPSVLVTPLAVYISRFTFQVNWRTLCYLTPGTETLGPIKSFFQWSCLCVLLIPSQTEPPPLVIQRRDLGKAATTVAEPTIAHMAARKRLTRVPEGSWDTACMTRDVRGQ